MKTEDKLNKLIDALAAPNIRIGFAPGELEQTLFERADEIDKRFEALRKEVDADIRRIDGCIMRLGQEQIHQASSAIALRESIEAIQEGEFNSRAGDVMRSDILKLFESIRRHESRATALSVEIEVLHKEIASLKRGKK